MDSPAGAVGYVSMVAAMTGATAEGVEAVTDVEEMERDAPVTSAMLGGMAARKPGLVARKKSKLMIVAEEAARALLLKTLKGTDWNLTAAAEALDLSGPSNVLQAIKRYELTDEYDKAHAAGKISPGNRVA